MSANGDGEQWQSAVGCATRIKIEIVRDESTIKMITAQEDGRTGREIVFDGNRGDGDEREWWYVGVV